MRIAPSLYSNSRYILAFALERIPKMPLSGLRQHYGGGQQRRGPREPSEPDRRRPAAAGSDALCACRQPGPQTPPPRRAFRPRQRAPEPRFGHLQPRGSGCPAGAQGFGELGARHTGQPLHFGRNELGNNQRLAQSLQLAPYETAAQRDAAIAAALAAYSTTAEMNAAIAAAVGAISTP